MQTEEVERPSLDTTKLAESMWDKAKAAEMNNPNDLDGEQSCSGIVASSSSSECGSDAEEYDPRDVLAKADGVAAAFDAGDLHPGFAFDRLVLNFRDFLLHFPDSIRRRRCH